MRIRKHHIILATIIAAAGGMAYVSHQMKSAPVPPVSPVPQTQSQCDDSLWQHTYTGDPRKFQKPQDRLHVIESCKTVIGTIINAVAEKDGDWHIRLDVDDKSLLNDMNMSGQHGYLVLEPVCENPVSQRDTLQEGSCDNYQGHIFDQSMIGKRVSVIGAFVLDEEHGWQEIHPVTSINNL